MVLKRLVCSLSSMLSKFFGVSISMKGAYYLEKSAGDLKTHLRTRFRNDNRNDSEV